MLILLVLPTVWDLVVQACRYLTCRATTSPDAVAEVLAAVCHPTEGATP